MLAVCTLIAAGWCLMRSRREKEVPPLSASTIEELVKKCVKKVTPLAEEWHIATRGCGDVFDETGDWRREAEIKDGSALRSVPPF
eukprot:gene9431-20852_t